MYLNHFRLQQEPFSIAPDPAFLFLSDAHNEALAHLLYGFSHGGFVLISGEVGTGKTTLLRNLLDRTPADVDVAFILNPRLTVRELLETLCEELGIITKPLDSVKQYIDILNKYLLATHQNGRSTVVVIDEAQNLTPAVLEQIRLLTNLETNDKKLLRIILLGQPELVDMLARTELRQLSQRITARYHLASLNKAETHQYVSHRLAWAGGNPDIFTKGAVNALYRLSSGTPRLINIIADRAMLGAYSRGEYKVSASLIRSAAKEVFGVPAGRQRSYYIAASAVIVLALGALLWAWIAWQEQRPAEVSATTTAPAALSQPASVDPGETTEQPPAGQTLDRIARSQNPMVSNTGLTQADNPASTTADATTTVNRAADNLPAMPVDVRRPDMRAFELQRNAFAQVFSAWQADYQVDSALIPCDFAPQAGLQCLRRNGGWSEVRQLNRPVVLELWDDQPSPYYAALLAQNGDQYRLVLGDQAMLVRPADLRQSWYGTYILMWQTPPGYQGSIRQGDEHDTVGWLAEKLQLIQPGADIPADNYFGPQLRQAVLEFQRSEGLLADGVVGPLTWIKLYDRLQIPAPGLT